MFIKHVDGHTKIACLIWLLALPFAASSCGQSEASAPKIPMEVVTSVIHDYGSTRGPIGPGSLVKPEETETHYRSHIATLLFHGDFPQLEEIAAKNRLEKGRLVAFGRTTSSTRRRATQ
jgi:hypothetical protein